MEDAHPNRCWRIRINNRSLMGINNTKKCTVFLSFLEMQVTAAPGYTPRHAACQEPGLKIFGGVLRFLRSFTTGVLPGAPGAQLASPEDPRKMAVFREFGRLVIHSLPGPSCMVPDPGFRKMAESLEFGRLTTGVSPGRSRPQLIHRLSPPY